MPGLPSPNRLSTARNDAVPEELMRTIASRIASSWPKGTVNWYCTKPRGP
jgi:hypothetical protein